MTGNLIHDQWSWIISSSTSLFFISVIAGLFWKLYQKQKPKRRCNSIMYQSIEVNKELLDLEDPTKINALVTGGSGTLGKEIVNHLLKHGGYKVHSLDLFITEDENRNSEICSYIQTDITNLEDLSIALKGMDVVFHTAAILPTVISAKDSDFENVNLKGTKNVITACKECKVKRLIFTSTVTVVLEKDLKGVKDINEDHPIPKESPNAYVRTKRGAEEAVLAANGDSGLTTCTLRAGGILDTMIKTRLKRPYFIQRKGIYSLCPAICLEDLATLHVRMDEILISKSKVAAGRAFNVASNISTIELSKAIGEKVGKQVRRISPSLIILLTYFNEICYNLTGTAPFGQRLNYRVLDFVVSLTSHTYCSAQAQRVLGWEPTPWKDTVNKYIEEWKTQQ